jgi:RHS repeat-associated protein
VGDYTYDPVRPHVLATVNGLAYGHDAVGNQMERPGNVVLTYDAHDKPVRITQNGLDVASFVYDGLGTRARKAALHEVTTYAGELYERHEKEDGSVEHILRVAADGRTVAEVAFQANSAGATPARSERYLHPDHLGSPDVITGKGGTLLKRRSYTPFGQRRSPNWADTGPAPAPLTTGEGFTGHEEEDEVGLVYMKGRTYDPKLGRFLQMDPLVSAPAFSQSWNPFAYV